MESVRIVRAAGALAIMVGLDAFMLWVVLTGPKPSEPLSTAIVLAFLVAPLGGMWMFYDFAYHSRRPWPYVLCAFIPYFFVWHYFQFVRGRRPAAEASPSNLDWPGHPSQTVTTDSAPLRSRRTGLATWVPRLLWAFALLSCAAVGLTAVVGPWWPYTKVQMGLILVFFAVHPFGSLWMLYHSFRYEQRPLPFVFLAFIPYSFLWYYFDRVKGKQSG